MSTKDIDSAQELMRHSDWHAAIPYLQRALSSNSENAHVWYLLGQCYRFISEIESAIKCLSRATSINQTQPSYFLALGIVNQLSNKFDASLSALRIATSLDPDYVEAFISAAITLKRIEKFEKSIEIFDAAANALARQFLIQTPNTKDTEIYGYRQVQGTLWMEFGLNAVLRDAALCNVDGILLPTSESAQEEYRTRRNMGLFWQDSLSNENSTKRIIFPNFLDGIREYFIRDKRYCAIIGDKGMVLESLNKREEARLHFNEATEFQNLG